MDRELILGEAAQVLAGISDNTFESIVTDPPSGTNMIVPFQKSGDESRYVDFDSPLGKLRYNFKTQVKVNLRLRSCFKDNVWPVLVQAARTLKPGGYGLFWGLQKSLHWLSWGLEEAGLAPIDILVFEVPARRLKSPLVGSKSTQLVQKTELWVLARKPGENTASATESLWSTGYMNILQNGAKITNLWKIGRPRRITCHPTEKPVSQMRDLVRLVTPPGGTVLDPFMGSGTTGVAAAQEGRKFFGIEKIPQWYNEALTRIDWPVIANSPG